MYKIVESTRSITNQSIIASFAAEVQAAGLQDASDGRQAAEVDQLEVEPQEVRRERDLRQRREGQQDVRQRTGPELSLPRQRR